jgi:hypothetical protein
MTDEDDSGGDWGKNCSMTTATGLIYRQSSNQIYREQLIQGQGFKDFSGLRQKTHIDNGLALPKQR